MTVRLPEPFDGRSAFTAGTSFPKRVTLALRVIAAFRRAFLAGRHGAPALSPREGALYLAAVDVVRLYIIGEHDFSDESPAPSAGRRQPIRDEGEVGSEPTGDAA